MGRRLSNKTNVDTTDVNFPNARIKDNLGNNEGTPFDEDVYGDIHQTQERIAEEASLEADMVFNESPDSAFNGYEFFKAKRKVQDLASLYENGRFKNVAANFGTVDFISDCFVWQNEIYVSDQGGDVVKVFNLFTLANVRTIGSGSLDAPLQSQVIYNSTYGGYLLYVNSSADAEIRVFDAKDGTRQAAYDITTVLTNPTTFQIDNSNDRIYVLEASVPKVEVFLLSTQAHQPGESWVPGTMGHDMFCLFSQDRIYIARNNTEVKAYQVDGTAVGTEDLSGLTALKSIHIIGRKLYITHIASDVIQAYRLKPAASPSILTEEIIPNSVCGEVTSFFIRNGVLYICDTVSNDILPITCVNVQEHL